MELYVAGGQCQVKCPDDGRCTERHEEQATQRGQTGADRARTSQPRKDTDQNDGARRYNLGKGPPCRSLTHFRWRKAKGQDESSQQGINQRQKDRNCFHHSTSFRASFRVGKHDSQSLQKDSQSLQNPTEKRFSEEAVIPKIAAENCSRRLFYSKLCTF